MTLSVPTGNHHRACKVRDLSGGPYGMEDKSFGDTIFPEDRGRSSQAQVDLTPLILYLYTRAIRVPVLIENRLLCASRLEV